MPVQMTATLKLRISRLARERYALDPFRFSTAGHIILTDSRSMRVFVQEINEQRERAGRATTEPALKAGQLNALALIDCDPWGPSLLEGYLDRLLGSLDLLTEEEKVTFQGPGAGAAVCRDAFGSRARTL